MTTTRTRFSTTTRRQLAWLSPFLAVAAVLFGAAPAYPQTELVPEPVALSGKVLQLDPEDPDRQRVGRMIWRGGLEISSHDARFGGLSGMLVSSDGRRLLAVSDKGDWLTTGLRYDGEGRLAGIEDGRMARLRGPDGDVLSKKRLRDSEGLAELADGSILVSFEREHRIWRYAWEDGSVLSRPTVWSNPEGLDDAPSNSGLEAIAGLADGGLFALTEEHEDETGMAGYLWRDGTWSRLAYQPARDFKPTGASDLPGSDDLLVLERAAQSDDGFHTRLVRLAAGDIRPGAELRGEELARWSLPLTIDKFESLASRHGLDGETLIYLLSDDGFNEDQRTLLLMFELED